VRGAPVPWLLFRQLLDTTQPLKVAANGQFSDRKPNQKSKTILAQPNAPASTTLAQRLPSRVGDLHANDLDGAVASPHAFGCRGREFGLDQLNQHCAGEAMRQHDRLGAALGAGSEQFEGAAALAARGGHRFR
jgi:hypothetical protein